MQIELTNHTYEIVIQTGGLREIGQWVQKLWQPQKIAIITDSNVAPLFGEQTKNALQAAGFPTDVFVVPAGEASKSLAQAEKLYEQLAAAEFTRSDGIVALGGGVIGDLAGFVASTYMRGLHFLQVPTTLLAQVDSSIGGKTAVNTQSAKNLVGSFAQPDGVLIDPAVLATLDKRRVREGTAEIIKAAAIADRALWQRLLELEDEMALVEHAEEIIPLALKVKKTVVEEDEFDHGSRLLLNFGHTIGHGIENTAGYDVVSHGEAVALGMVMISRQAETRNLTPVGTTEQLIQMLKKYHLPVEHDALDAARIYQAITHDKKARGKQIKIILLEEIGQAKIVSVPMEALKNYIVSQ
ncbi:3-dehydroquinate synthase [Enterococcus sp. LJL98]